jgi:hypothetical protein
MRNIRTARELVIQFYGTLAITIPRESDYTIGTDAVPLGVPSIQRLGLILSCTGTVDIAIGYSPDVTITTGILLKQYGVFISNWYYDLELCQAPLWAIGANSDATLHMVENAIAGA